MKTEHGTEYRCDFCNQPLTLDFGKYLNGVGVYTYLGASGFKVDASESAINRDKHYCYQCISSLQESTPVICGAGIECKGGPKCGSSHK